MIYYKIIEDDKIVSLEERPMASTDSSMIEITEEEYNAIIAEIFKATASEEVFE